MDNEIQKKLDNLVKNSDLFVAAPDTIRQLQAQGLPVKSIFTTYQEYLDKLFAEKRQLANEIINKLPHLDQHIANSTISSLYEELKECFVLGIPGASITLAIILLDVACKFRLYDERKKVNNKSGWKSVEELHLREAIMELKTRKVITEIEKKRLLAFNKEVRNSYLHYKIQKLVRDMILAELPSVNIETGDVTIEKNVKPENRPFLWFSAKKVLDKQTVESRVKFCVNWVNKLLS